MINIVLVEPEIPQNTGNIVRTAAATGANVHIVRPIGFDVSDSRVKRAGLDYWYLVNISYYDSFDEVRTSYPDGKFFYASTKAQRIYSECDFNVEQDVFLVFGKETKGLPEALINDNYDYAMRIPMVDEARSLNLSNSVAIIVYEALRQQGFEGLKTAGKLTQF